MTRISVRLRQEADLAEAAKVLSAVHESDGYPVEGVADPEAWLTPRGMTAAWVAELNGHVVGHAAVNHPQAGDKAARMWSEQSGETEVRVGVLARLFVGREARNASAGANLVKAATSYARQSDLRLVLDVLTKDAAAIRLYERLGWQRIGETVHVFGDGQRRDAICFVSPTP